MAYYRLYFTRRGHFFRCHDFHAEGDGEAVAVATGQAGPDPMELWCGSRKVRAFAAIETRAPDQAAALPHPDFTPPFGLADR